MDSIKPLVTDQRGARHMLADCGLTKLYDLTNRGEIERKYIDNKAVWTVASIEDYVARLASTPPPSLEKRNRNMKFVREAHPE